MWHAREFLERLPFWDMRPDDRLSRGAATIAVGIGGGRTSAMGPQVLAQSRPGLRDLSPQGESHG